MASRYRQQRIENRHPAVSVVMTVYNGERYIGEAVDSILGQSWNDFELIIVDDGSQDHTAEIISGYDDPRIKWYRNDKNRGICYSANRGIAAARGNYIARLDSDDVSYPLRLEKQVKYLEEHKDVMLCATLADRIIDGKARLPEQKMTCVSAKVIRLSMIFDNVFTHSTVMFRRAPYVSGGYSYQRYIHAHDYDLLLKLSLRYNTAVIPEVLVGYRIHNTQITNTYPRNRRLKEAEDIKKKHIEALRIPKEAKEFLKKASVYGARLYGGDICGLNKAIYVCMRYFRMDRRKNRDEYQAARELFWRQVYSKAVREPGAIAAYLCCGLGSARRLCSPEGIRFCKECMGIKTEG